MTNTNTASGAAMQLADQYAAAHAKWALEDLYGTSKSYTAKMLKERHALRSQLAAELASAAAPAAPALPAEQPDTAYAALPDDRESFKAYLKECDEYAIVPDVAGAFNAAWQRATRGQAPAQQGVQWQCGPQANGFMTPQADSVTAAAATVIKKGAERQWMSERLGHLPDGIYSLYLAPPTQAADSVLEDAVMLDWLKEETCDLRCVDVPTGGDDAETQWVVIEHHMAKPQEREIGRSYTDDPRDAIRAAMAAKKGEAT